MGFTKSDLSDYDYDNHISNVNVWEKVFAKMNKRDFVKYMIQAEKVKQRSQKKIS